MEDPNNNQYNQCFRVCGEGGPKDPRTLLLLVLLGPYRNLGS